MTNTTFTYCASLNQKLNVIANFHFPHENTANLVFLTIAINLKVKFKGSFKNTLEHVNTQSSLQKAD